MKVTNTIPIVIIVPIAAHNFVASLERPGGNVTGVRGLTADSGGKWLELLKETIPSVKRVAGFWNRAAEDKLPIWKSVELAARSLKIELDWLEVGGRWAWGYPRDEIARRFHSAVWRGADGLIVLPGVLGSVKDTTEMIDLAKKDRLPGMFWSSSLAEMGGLMSYGTNSIEQSRRAAYVLDRILKSAKPAELSVERPTQFELVINLKTAKEIGVTVHPEVLMWADRVIK
jgi:putative ABC transport system substrate-binding protein